MNPASRTRSGHFGPGSRTLRGPIGTALCLAAAALLGAGILCFVAGAALAAPPVGTPVDNSAGATALHPVSGLISLRSDTVRTFVQPIESLSLEASRSVTADPGDLVALAHRITNTGNTAASIRFDVANLAGDGFDVAALALSLDVNGDGVKGGGESFIAPGDTLRLEPGESLDLVLDLAVPPAIAPPGPALVRVTATGLAQGTIVANTDTIHVRGATVGGVVLFAEKSVSRNVAEAGDVLEYMVRIANRSDSTLAAFALIDDLPPGFAYAAGSASRDGAPLADPAGGAGPRLTFDLGTLDALAAAVVRYRVRVQSGAPRGDALNTAWAVGDGTPSNTASARVTVTGGVFADEASILGAVYMDADRDGRRGAGDTGLAGVRLYLDDGTFALTDRDGQYSIYGVTPRTVALKLDPSSLPDHAVPIATDHRQDRTPTLRFVDLQRGELARADFVVQPDSTKIPPPREFPRMIAGPGSELTRAIRRDLPRVYAPDPTEPVRAQPASGWLDTPPGSADSTLAFDSAPPRPEHDVLAFDDPRPGFANLADGDTLRSSQIRVVVKGRAGFGFELRLNGTVIPNARVGRTSHRRDLGIELREYIGVDLPPGVNELALKQTDPEGRAIGEARVRIVAPGPLARLEILSAATAEQGGRAPVRLRALDAHGVPVATRTLVTLESSAGEWLDADLDPVAPGVQIAIEGGERPLAFAPPADPGRVTLAARAGRVHAETAVAFIPSLTPLLAVGTFEGVVTFDHLSKGFRAASRTRTGFEAPIETFRSERRDGRASASARGAMFMKGRIHDDILVTVGYDSDRPDGLRRARDVQPDAYYPVYGDASVRGYDAQTTGALYARVDRGGSSTLYGDFVTRSGGGPRSLAGYQRSLTGVQQRYESSRMRVDAFSSRERARLSVEEFPGFGISGPYALAAAPILENSEQVEILVRDRDQPGVVLSASPRVRFVDYEVEALSGRITFKTPVPGFDAALNPVSIRVSYARMDGGAAYWVSGAETRMRVTEVLEVGGTYVDDHDPLAATELRGAFLGAKLGAATVVEGEYATTRSAGRAPGGGVRLELRHTGPDVQGELLGAVTDSAFDNPYAGFSRGRSEAMGRLRMRLGENSRLLADARFSAQGQGGGRLGGLLLGFDRGLGESLRGEFGTRVSVAAQPGGRDSLDLVTLRMKLTGQPRRFPALSAYTEFEQDLRHSARQLAALGGEWRFDRMGRIYARHEWASTLGGAYSLNDTQRRLASVIGIDSDFARDAHVFGELRAADALLHREAEAAVGLRHIWRAGSGLRVHTTFERIEPLRAEDTGPTTAVTGAVESVEDEDVKTSARIEARSGRAVRSVLGTMAVAARVDESWTALARNLLTIADDAARGHSSRDWLQLGMAFRRPQKSAWDALGRYELRFDTESGDTGARQRRVAHILSLHGGGPVRPAARASLAWAGKAVFDREAGVTVRSTAQWLHGRWAWEFDGRWDAGVHGSVLFVNDLRSRQDGLGIEVGRVVANGVWVSGGWNRFGYDDQDLPTQDYLRAGFYLRLRAKFDESLFGGGIR
jgi:uncharacterized repeat protein (TIGR01451 family)